MTTDLPGRLDTLADRLVEPGPAPVTAIRDRARVHRGRRRRLLGGAVAVLVALAGAGATFLARGPVRDETPAITPPNAVLEGAPCSARTQFTSLPLPADGHVAVGATSAQLCPLYNGWQAPRDVLTTGVDGLIQLIDRQPVLSSQGPCLPSHNFTEYSIAFAYPDGSTSAVVGEINDGCRSGLYTSPYVKGTPQVTKEGAQDVLSAYVGALAAQRATQSPPVISDPTSGRCTHEEGALPDSIVGPRNELDLASGEVCTYKWTEVGKDEFAYVLQGSKPLTATQVEILNDRYREDAEPVGSADVDYDVKGLFTTIAGVTPWGDTVTLELLKDGLVRNRSIADPGQDALWRLSADQLAAVLGD